MTSTGKYVSVTSVLILASLLMACGTTDGGVSAQGASSSRGPNSSAGNAASSSPQQSTAQPTSPPATDEVVLAEGVVHRLCGLDLGVKFIPPSVTSESADQAFLVAGNGSNGDQPRPGTVAPAHPGTVATVMDQRFEVVSIDVVAKRVTVRALC
jgi:hypothetical protein